MIILNPKVLLGLISISPIRMDKLGNGIKNYIYYALICH